VKRLLLTALAVAALAGTPTALTAHVSAADTALVLLRAAQRFQQQGDRRLAEALFALIARDYASSPAGLEAGQRLAALRGALRAGSGRVELIVWGTMYGAWLGIGVPLMLEADDPTPYGAGLLLGAPLGFLTARSYGNSTSMSVGQARAIRWGTIWGTWQGAGWREVLDIGDRTETYCAPPEYGGYCNTYRAESDVAPVTAAVLGGVAGMLASAAIARKVDIAPGTGSLVKHVTDNTSPVTAEQLGATFVPTQDQGYDIRVRYRDDATAKATTTMAASGGSTARNERSTGGVSTTSVLIRSSGQAPPPQVSTGVWGGAGGGSVGLAPNVATVIPIA